MTPVSAGTATVSQAATAAAAVTGPTVTADPAGTATLKWDDVPGATAYAVLRWHVNDLSCSKNVSPPGGTSGRDGNGTSLPDYLIGALGLGTCGP